VAERAILDIDLSRMAGCDRIGSILEGTCPAACPFLVFVSEQKGCTMPAVCELNQIAIEAFPNAPQSKESLRLESIHEGAV